MNKEVEYIPPEYKITDKLLGLVVEGEKMLKDISNADLTAASRAKLQENAIVESIYGLSRLIGNPITRGEAKKIRVGKLPQGRRYKVLSNYRSVIEYIRDICNSGLGEFNYSVLLHLNKLVGDKVGDDWDLGRLRAPGDVPKNEFEPFPPKKIDATLVTKTLPQLVKYLEATSTVHPLIRGTILLSDLIQLYPFTNLNAVTVFAAFDLFCNIKNIGGESLIPIWAIVSEEPGEFVGAYQDIVESGESIDKLLELVSISWNKEVEKVRREVVKLSYHEEIKGKAKFLNLNHRQLAALRYLQTHIKITRQEYKKLFKVSAMTAYRDLSDMLDKKLLNSGGHGRGTYYVLVTKT